ncbi:hypothetical protein [Qipengyuania atrilutea]|uniref:Lipoprotein n=1 Tax=Qipengyuania atrilutea TaxID=2744473 RepID=A0A850H2E2_9SPHN|nr:hypothetical protein [Actirhodobacter atriluteus]NVD44078.1 hypothetical protein [Actirhodobacter atriluteus]
MHRIAFGIIVLVSVSACDVATEMAGDALKGEVRTQYLNQCQGVAESSGIAAERITAACECSADDFADDFTADGDLNISRARIEQVLQKCVRENGEAAPAEG